MGNHTSRQLLKPELTQDKFGFPCFTGNKARVFEQVARSKSEVELLEKQQLGRLE